MYGRKLALSVLLLASAACNQEKFSGGSAKKNGAVSREFAQDAYPITSQVFTQGNRGTPQTDSFDQGEYGKLDILIVVDNSASMADEQANLANKLEPLISKVEKADWQIAVVTTDPTYGCLNALIKKGDANAADRFSAAVIAAGIKGSGTERGIAQAVNALKCTSNGSWIRPESTVAILILSDEDNCHIGNADDDQYACQYEAGRNASHLVNYLSSIRTIGKDARVYGIIWQPDVAQSACSTALNRGHTYNEAIVATSGKSGSICDTDYTATLQSISDDVSRILKFEFEVAQVPDAGSLQILVNGENWDKFVLVGRTVKFSEPPPFGSKVEVVYKYGKGSDIVTSFTLSKKALGSSLKVTVDGELVPASAYSFDESTNVLVFKEAPQDRASIKVEYKEIVTLKKTFVIDRDAEPSTIEVTVDGKKVTGFTFDATTGTVTLKEAAPESAKVDISFKGKI